MVIYKCIKKFPGGPNVGTILRRGNHEYVYGDSKLHQSDVETSPEYFTKIEALVHSFKNQYNGNIYTLNIDKFPSLEYHGTNTIMNFDTCINRYKIWSVLRIDTGDIYRVGKWALYNGHYNKPLKIEEFRLYKDEITIMVHYAGDPEDTWYDDFIGYCDPFDYDDEEKKKEKIKVQANIEQEERFQRKYHLSCYDIFKFMQEKYPSAFDGRWERQHFYNFVKENKISNDN